MDRSSFRWPGAHLAVASAVLFGASTPFAKLLIGTIDPWLLAGLLYLAAGIGLYLVTMARRAMGRRSTEAPLRVRDAPWLTAIILSGGVVGPVMLMLGLSTVSASTTALLLNLEGLATLAIAWIVFKENVDHRVFIGAMAILAGAAVLSWDNAGIGADMGVLAIAGACLAWGIDNNLTRKLSSVDPVQITTVKGLAAGTVNLLIALAFGATLPDWHAIGAVALIGFFGYGVSIVLFVFALRHLGTARTGAYFSTAPFIGALLAIVVLAEPVTWRLVAAGVLMAIGVYLHLAERHEHKHVHEPMEHEHRHVHDEHHQHVHVHDDPKGEPHSHPHRHGRLVHSHPHYPDLHHRHGH